MTLTAKTVAIISSLVSVLVVAAIVFPRPDDNFLTKGLHLFGVIEDAPSVSPTQTKPINAATLAGRSGLYYLQAENLIGIIEPDNFSAYDSLVEEGRIAPDSVIQTDKNSSAPTPTPNPAIIPTNNGISNDDLDAALAELRLEMTQEYVSSVEAGLGLSGGGGAGTVQLNVVPGEGIIIQNDQVVAILGSKVELLTEVAGVLSIANGGTGLAAPLPAGKLMVSTGSGYAAGTMAAGDGVSLSVAGSTYTYGLDGTVCRTSGNCAGAGAGIVGGGTAGELAFFTAEDTISSTAGLAWDSGTSRLTITGSVNSTAGYLVNGVSLSTSHVLEGANLYYTQGRFDTAFGNKTTDDLAEGATALYWTDGRFDSRLLTKSTSDMSEGSNLYYTDARVSANTDVSANTAARHDAATVADSSTLDLAIVGQQIAGSVIQSGLQTSLLNNDAGFIANLSTFTTDNLAEGLTNKYWSQALFDAALTGKSTTDLAEGANLYWTGVRFDSAFGAKSTTDLSEGTNLYYTQSRFDTAFAAKNTDNLSQGVVNLYYSSSLFDTDFNSKNTDDLTEGTNKYYSDALFGTSLALRTSDDVAEGSTNLYYTEARVSANTDVAANTAARHDAVTISDSGTIDLTLNGQQLTASIMVDSLGFAEVADALTLDASTDIAISAGLQLSTSGAGAVAFNHAGDTTFAGNVGIGLATPAAKLTVAAGNIQEIGSNLVTNGSFDTDSSGWVLGACGSYSSGELLLNYTSYATCSDPNLQTSINTEAGKSYKVEFEITSTNDAVAYNTDAGYSTSYADGSHTGYFTANNTGTQTLSFELWNWDDNTFFTLDNVSVTEVIVEPSIIVQGMDGSDIVVIGDSVGSSPVMQVFGNISSPGTQSKSEKFGFGAIAAGKEVVAIGYNAQAGGGASYGNAVAVGYNANAGWCGGGTAIGSSAATGCSGIAIGYDTQAYGTQSIAIGRLAQASASHSIALGRGAIADEANSLVVGASSYAISNIYFGNGRVNTAPTAYTINGTGGNGTDIAGGALQIAGGRGTGSALGGDIVFLTSSAGVSGATLNGLTERLRVGSSGIVSITGALSVSNGLTVSGGTVSLPAGSVLAAAIAPDSLNFTELSDSLALDVSTDILIDLGRTLSTSGDGNVAFNHVGNTTFAGNVGIGTAPTVALDVAGDGKVSGSLTTPSILAATSGNIIKNTPIAVAAIQGQSRVYNDSPSWISVGADGFSRILYYDNWEDLRFVRCLDEYCQSTINTVVATIINGLDYPTFIMGPDGFARILYHTYDSPAELRYIQCLDVNCDTKTDTLVTTAVNNGFYEKSLTLATDGTAHILYTDYTYDGTRTLNYLTCSTQDCSAHQVTTISSNTIPKGPGGIVVAGDGFARFVYWEGASTNDAINYVQCTNADCSTRNINLLDNGDPYYINLAIGSDGFARVSYDDADYSQSPAYTEVKLLTCGNDACSVNVTEIVDILSGSQMISMALDSSDIAHFALGESNVGVKYKKCMAVDCSTTSNTVYLGGHYYPVSIALDQNDVPVIANMNLDSAEIMHSKIISLDDKYIINGDGSNIGTAASSFDELFVSQINGDDLYIAQNARIGSNLDIANNVKIDGKLSIGTAASLNKLDVKGGVAIGSYAGINAAPSNGLIVSGNVGIGTNAPRYTLDVAGTLATTSNSLVLGENGAIFSNATENLLFKAGASNLATANVISGTMTKTNLGGGKYHLENTGAGYSTLRMYVNLADLVDGSTYAYGVSYENLTGNGSFYSDWNDSAYKYTSTYVGTSGRLINSGSRADYTTIYRFLDITLGPGMTVDVFNEQVEAGSVSTPFTRSSRNAGDLVMSGALTANQVLASTTGNVLKPTSNQVAVSTSYFNPNSEWMDVDNSGNANMLYLHGSSGSEISFIRCLDEACATKTTTHIATNNINIGVDAGFGAPIVKIASDGLPRLAYIEYGADANDYLDSTLHFVQCLNADCTSRTNTVVGTMHYNYVSMELAADDTARLSYKEYTFNNPIDPNYYVQCLNADCSSSTAPVELLTENAQHGSDFTLGADGFARFAYTSNVGALYTVKLLQCTSADCSTKNTSTVLSSYEGGYASVQMGQDNFPRIMVASWVNRAPTFIQCTSADCSTFNSTPMAPAGYIDFADMYIGNDGYPRIVLADTETTYFQCTSDDCSTSNSFTLDIASDGVQMEQGLDGYPRIATPTYTSGSRMITYHKLASESFEIVVPAGASTIGTATEAFDALYVDQVYGENVYSSGLATLSGGAKVSSDSGAALSVYGSQAGSVYGTNLITNGDLNTITGWTLGAGWTHDVTNLEVDHAAGNTATLSYDLGTLSPVAHKVTITIRNRTAGSVTISLGGAATSSIPYNYSPVNYLTPTSGNLLEITPSSDFNGTIDSVSVQRFESGATALMNFYNESESLVLEIKADGSNMIFGAGSGGVITSGNTNTIFGNYALTSNTTGSRNTGMGLYALWDNTTGSDNLALGVSAMDYSGTGNENVALGNYALMYNTSGNYNIGLGYQAGMGDYEASEGLIGNVFIGHSAGMGVRTGASHNTIIGYLAGDSISTGSRNIIIGYDVDAASATGSDQLNIGNLIAGSMTTGSKYLSLGGDVAIGRTNPGAGLDVYKFFTSTNASEQYGTLLSTDFNIADTGMKQGLRLNTSATQTSGTIDSLNGLIALTQSVGSGGLVNNVSSIWSRIDAHDTSTITNAFNLQVENGLGTGQITNQYGLYVANLTKGTNTNYAIYTAGSTESYFGGNVGLGVSAGSAAKLVVQGANDTATLGTEKVLNGAFTTDTAGWTLGAGWSHDVANGEVDHVSGITTLSQDAGEVSGEMYRLVYTVKNHTIGSVNASIAGKTDISRSSNSTFTFDLLASSVADLTFTPSSDFNGTIDDVSLMRIISNTPLVAFRSSSGVDNLEIRAGDGSIMNNTFIGLRSGSYVTTGFSNTAFGSQALENLTTGIQNAAFGRLALKSTTSGRDNAAFGNSAMYFNTTGSFNTALGAGALINNTEGSNNIAVGSNVLFTNTLGNSNAGVGSNSLYWNTTGSQNVALGYRSLWRNTAGDNNTGLGYQANYYNQAGSNGVYIGYEAGRGTALHSKSGNVFIGYQAGYNETGSNLLYIENSNSATPLIKGDFANDTLTFNGSVTITNGLTVTSGVVSLPAGSVAGAAIADDSLDFDKIKAATTLDESTSIDLNGNTLSTTGSSGINFAHTGDTTFAGRVLIGPHKLDEVASEPVNGGADDLFEIAVAGNYAYNIVFTTFSTDSRLEIFDIANPLNPSFVSSMSVEEIDTNQYEARVSGSYLYLAAAERGLQIIDISNPSSPVQAYLYPTIGAIYGFDFYGNYLVVADGWEGIKILDISNPASPSLVGSSVAATWAEKVQVVGDYAYVSDSSAGFKIFDISNPASPSLVGSFTSINEIAYDLVVDGNYVYLSDSNGGDWLQIIDVTNPASPQLVDEISIQTGNGTFRRMTLDGDRLYVVDSYGWGGSVYVFNVADPLNVQWIDTYTPSGASRDVEIMGDKILIANGVDGMSVLQQSTGDGSLIASSLKAVSLRITGSAVIEGGLTVINAKGETFAPDRSANGQFGFAEVSATGRLYFRANDKYFYINSSGTGDYSEYFLKANPSEELLTGMIVTLDGGGVTASGMSNRPLGVISAFGTRNNDDNEDGMRHLDAGYANVGLMGQIPVLVTAESGPIMSGDSIGLPISMPGFGTKAIGSDFVMAQAIQSFVPGDNCQSIGSIEVLKWINEVRGQNESSMCWELPDGTVIGRIMAYVSSTSMQGIKSDSANSQQIAELTNAWSVSNGVVSTEYSLVVGGDLTVNGALVVGGPAEFRGPAIFKAMAEFIDWVTFKNKVEFKDRVYFDKDTSGEAIIKQGEDRIEVVFAQEYEQKPSVNVTLNLVQSEDDVEAIAAAEKALQDQGYSYFVSQKDGKGFTIILNKPATTDVTFSWTALTTKVQAEQDSPVVN